MRLLKIGGKIMICPYCQDSSETGTKVTDTSHDKKGGIRRRRECKNCGERFTTYERPMLTPPMIVKHDGSKENFNSEKVLKGIQLACVKRPVSQADMERLTGEIENQLALLGKVEVESKIVGDLIIEGLKELDQIAYIRFALVYLGLDDIQSIRSEIDRLIEIQ